MATNMVTYVTHERKTEGELITVPACGEKCFFPKGHKGKHSAGKPEGIWAVSGMGDMYITSRVGAESIANYYKPEQYWFAMARDEDGAEYTGGWCIVGHGATPEALTASMADTFAAGEEVPEKSLLEFLAAFKAWLASDQKGLAFSDPARYQFRHYLWGEMPSEERCPLLNIVVQCMPNYGT